MTESDLQDLLDGLIPVCCPELLDAPNYCVRVSDGALSPAGCDGFTWTLPLPELELQLRQSGRWRGPGRIIGITSTDDDPAYLTALLLHELAHLVPGKPPLAITSDSDDVEHNTRAIKRFREIVTTTDVTRNEAIPWADHCWRFIRAYFHLEYRAGQAGFQTFGCQLCAGPTYDLQSPSAYWMRMAHELEPMRTWTFRQIEAESPPPAFLELFESDVDKVSTPT